MVLAQLGSQEVIHWKIKKFNFQKESLEHIFLNIPSRMGRLHLGHLAVDEGAGETLSLPLLPPLLPVSGLPWLKTQP